MSEVDILNNIEIALEEIRPYLLADGGNISLVDVKENVVSVRLHGSCYGCHINHLTLKNGVEAMIKKHVPQII
jgi:Fe-S cluster biogenesis protein NfuA